MEERVRIKNRLKSVIWYLNSPFCIFTPPYFLKSIVTDNAVFRNTLQPVLKFAILKLRRIIESLFKTKIWSSNYDRIAIIIYAFLIICKDPADQSNFLIDDDDEQGYGFWKNAKIILFGEENQPPPQSLKKEKPEKSVQEKHSIDQNQLNVEQSGKNIFMQLNIRGSK